MAASSKTHWRFRTPTRLQMEAVECGAAALASILQFHGRRVPLEQLRNDCAVSRDGAKASNIVKAARRYGLETKGVRTTADEALTAGEPFIAFWNVSHFVVVEGVKGDRVYLNDPGSGPRQVSREDFEESFSSVMLTFKPGPEFEPGGERPKLLPKLLPRLRGSGDAASIVMLFTLLLVVPGLVQPALIKTFIDDVLIRGYSNWVFVLVVGLIFSGAFSAFLTWVQQRYLLKMQMKLGVTIASEFFWHTLRLPVSFYAQRYIGDVAARVQSCHRLASLLAGPLPTTVIHALMIGFFGLVMLLFSWQLTVLVFALTFTNIAALQFAQRRRRDLNASLLNTSGKSQGAAMAGLQAMETLKASGTESDFFSLWSGYQTRTVNTQQQLSATTSVLEGVPSFLDHLMSALVLGGGALLIMKGQLTIGALIAFQALTVHVTTPIKHLVGLGSQLQEIEGDLDRLDDVLDNPQDPLLTEPPDDKTHSSLTPLSGQVELKDITFGYSPAEPPLIEGFSLKLKPGQRVALVGGSGSGKSTLAKLMTGLLVPQSGTVLYDDVPLFDLPRRLATRDIASVDQECILFAGTIRDNLTLWDDSVTDAAMRRATQDAMIHELIASRPGGYLEAVSEGGDNFSGGQRQRIEIARALIRDPAVLVLDEATAALDPVTEAQIDRALRRRGCTCVIVAHRLSTVRDADEIIMLEHGKVIERGTHEDLIALNGRYAALVGEA